jgi:hypothetical protein
MQYLQLHDEIQNPPDNLWCYHILVCHNLSRGESLAMCKLRILGVNFLLCLTSSALCAFAQEPITKKNFTIQPCITGNRGTTNLAGEANQHSTGFRLSTRKTPSYENGWEQGTGRQMDLSLRHSSPILSPPPACKSKLPAFEQSPFSVAGTGGNQAHSSITPFVIKRMWPLNQPASPVLPTWSKGFFFSRNKTEPLNKTVGPSNRITTQPMIFSGTNGWDPAERSWTLPAKRPSVNQPTPKAFK